MAKEMEKRNIMRMKEIRRAWMREENRRMGDWWMRVKRSRVRLEKVRRVSVEGSSARSMSLSRSVTFSSTRTPHGGFTAHSKSLCTLEPLGPLELCAHWALALCAPPRPACRPACRAGALCAVCALCVFFALALLIQTNKGFIGDRFIGSSELRICTFFKLSGKKRGKNKVLL